MAENHQCILQIMKTAPSLFSTLTCALPDNWHSLCGGDDVGQLSQSGGDAMAAKVRPVANKLAGVNDE